MRLYRAFHLIFGQFRDMYLAYVRDGSVSYAALAELIGSESDKGSLWLLKDRCHLLWRQEDGRNIEGCLLDLVIGSLFHESMKLKENIYLRERYRPQLEQYMHRPPAGEKKTDTSGSRSFKGYEWNRFLLRSGGETSSQMESLAFLFGQANYLLRLLLTFETGNRLLLRYLVEHGDLVEEFWHETLDELFNDLFCGSPELGYLGAARSYQEAQWYDRAKEAFRQALRLNPQCHEALQQIPQLTSLANVQNKLASE